MTDETTEPHVYNPEKIQSFGLALQGKDIRQYPRSPWVDDVTLVDEKECPEEAIPYPSFNHELNGLQELQPECPRTPCFVSNSEESGPAIFTMGTASCRWEFDG